MKAVSVVDLGRDNFLKGRPSGSKADPLFVDGQNLADGHHRRLRGLALHRPISRCAEGSSIWDVL